MQAGAAYAEPHPRGRLLRGQALDRHAIEEVTLRTVAGADPDHAPEHVHRADGGGEHRGANPVRAPVGGGDPGGEQRQRRETKGRCREPAQQ